MKSDSLIHDHAMSIAAAFAENSLLEDKRRNCFVSFVAACRAGLEQYEVKAERVYRRIRLSRN